MVRKIASVLALAMILPCLPALAADGEGKVSGVLKQIRPDGKLVIEEQGPWTGPGTGLVTRAVDINPATGIRVIRSTGRWQANQLTPGYEVEAADFRALQLGDFVTVTTAGGSTAVSVDVMRGESEAGLASPRSEVIGIK